MLAIHQYPPGPQEWSQAPAYCAPEMVQSLAADSLPDDRSGHDSPQLTFGLWDWSWAQSTPIKLQEHLLAVSTPITCPGVAVESPTGKTLKTKDQPLHLCTSPTKGIASNQYMLRKEATEAIKLKTAFYAIIVLI